MVSDGIFLDFRGLLCGEALIKEARAVLDRDRLYRFVKKAVLRVFAPDLEWHRSWADAIVRYDPSASR